MRITEAFEVHDHLNPRIWGKDNQLLPEVEDKINEIITDFISSADIELPVVDVRIVGSNASYNYTESSDLDLHVVVNFEQLPADPKIIEVLVNLIKASYNNKYDIKIHGIDVELYIEDIRSTAVSNGIYSVTKREWIKFPKKITDVKIPDLSKIFPAVEEKIMKVLENPSIESIQDMINKLYIIRKDSLASEGEYGVGNQLFKEVRGQGLLDKLKDAYNKENEKKLSLEHLTLHEDSRVSLLNKSKQNPKGFERYKKKNKSKVATSVRQYNSIDMNKLFKDDILTVDINVTGETDNYVVKISFGGFLDLLHDQLKSNNNELNLKVVLRALINGFNKDDVYINCTCPDWKYRYAYYATRNNIISGDKENRPSDITNPNDNLGSGCKHVLLVLSNTSWMLKVATTVYNYVKYIEKHYEKLYANVLYPAIYNKKYEEPVQLDIFDDDDLDSSTTEVDKSNEEGRTRGQFKKGNEYRFKPSENDRDQVSIDAAL